MPQGRAVNVKTPLPLDSSGKELLVFASMTGTDRISECFRLELFLLSYNPDIKSSDLLGEGITVSIEGDADKSIEPRYFHGVTDQFRFDGNDETGMYRYRLILRPTFWFLSKTKDNRIFQKKTVEDIVQEVFSDEGFSNFEFHLNGSYDLREYCVQYNESNLDFVQRLMEHEGIFYYFEFIDGDHKMMIVDDIGSLEPAAGASELEFEPNAGNGLDDYQVITRLERTDTAVPAIYTHTDYDFTKPSADLMGQAEFDGQHTLDSMERYSYPGRYTEVSRGKDLATIRNEEDRALSYVVSAESTARVPASGKTFKLFAYPREEENTEYFVYQADYKIWDGQYFATRDGSTDEGFEVRYQLIPTEVHFRPLRDTPKPVMRGPQTAVVVGPGGEEIHTDEYSRVKVQFFWDRRGKRDANSSCFIRVSSVWAGAGWGFIQIPRIGQEVIVDFLEGDPDQPIITGRVYNAEQMPPYGLPGNATQSGWKSNSSLGGGGWNEMRFEDKKGSEEVYFQAEKDHNELVKNDESRNIGHDFLEDVGNDATQNIGHDRTETVVNNKSTDVGVDRMVSIGNNDTESVGVDRSLSVGSNETIFVGSNSTETIGANHTQTVAINQTISVGVARIDTVGAAETRTVGAAQINTVGAMRSMSVGANQSHDIGAGDTWDVGANQTITIGGGQTVKIGKDQVISTAGARAEEVGKASALKVAEDMAVTVGKDLLIEAADSVVIKCGKASVSMKKDGTINIEGKDITLKGSGKINVTADGDITMKGSKINQN